MAGCAPKQLTREEFLVLNNATSAAMVREYPDITKERIITACEQALTQSDTDYNITQHIENGFYAHRRWFVYFILGFAGGENHWKITVEEKEGGNRVEARSWEGDGVSAGHIPVPMPGKSENEYYTSPSLYNLFFARVDYFLGLSQDWATCDNAKENLHPHEKAFALDPLCSLANTKDPKKD